MTGSQTVLPELWLPRALTAPTPGWTRQSDVVVVGSGIAGLAAAMHARRAGHKVLLVTKGTIDEGSTRWAQGGIAAALAEEDSPSEHLTDTLVAGAGLCDESAVRILAYEGPAAIRRLIDWGAKFDKNLAGDLELTREGGHHKNRIAHAGGDATGAEISRALVAAVELDPLIEVVQHALVLDLILDAEGAAQGLTLHVMGEGQRDGVGAVLAPAVVLATGGIGQVFSASTNPSVATGDGIALGLRAGAEVADIEFVQFHPTVLWLGGTQRGQQPLVSEAVRGEGAFLIDAKGERFMQGQHELADLAPRDVVAKAIRRRMIETGEECVWLDATHMNQEQWRERFPTVYESCRKHGFDPAIAPIPVAPAQHYVAGGLITDLNGRTSIPGLFAVGECACTGVHGANRLASNSLLEGLVFADRIGSLLASGLPKRRDPVPNVNDANGYGTDAEKTINAESRELIQDIMTKDSGVLRTDASTANATAMIQGLLTSPETDAAGRTETWEATNIATVATVLAHAAHMRAETRGSHWREDFPEADDEWRVRIVTKRGADGVLTSELRPVDVREA